VESSTAGRRIDTFHRYHLELCRHLLSREGEALPVGEAIELGFTPCGLCRPPWAILTLRGAQ
jgi:hypothetical protein